MKLLRISTDNDGYIVEAVQSVRVLKIKIAEKRIIFQKGNKSEMWTHKNGKGVNSLQERTLRRWIRDHQKYLEK